MFPLYFDRKVNIITEMRPSAMAKGICVIAYIPKNVTNEVRTLHLWG